MSSIAQLVSEIAHIVKQPDSIPTRRAIKLGIIHARNKLIRESFTNHGYVDRGLQQKFKLTLEDVPDEDLYGTSGLNIGTLKRTINHVPRPTRLANNLPFSSVRTAGVKNTLDIAYAKAGVSRYYSNLPGFCPMATYDYQNDYIYVNILQAGALSKLKAIIVEAAFEYPHLVPVETSENEPHKGDLSIDSLDDLNEFFLPEDMVGDVKKLILESWAINQNFIVRDTNEVPSAAAVI